MKKLALVTGGAGFIGSHTADALAKKGYRIRILDNLKPPVHSGRWPSYVRGKKYELIRGDVRDKGAMTRALRGVQFVYHLAAYQDQRTDFSTFFYVNTVSTALIYELVVAKKFPVKKIVLASSQFVYGDGKYACPHTGKEFYPELRSRAQFEKKKFDILCPHGAPAKFSRFNENEPPHPTNSYGLSKYALEHTGLRLGKTYDIPTTVFRYSIVQGARQSPKNIYSGALRIFVQQALAGVPITVYEDGNQTRDFVNIHDVVRANLLALTNKKTDYEIFNVGGAKAIKVIDFARAVARITGSYAEIKIGAYRRTDTRHAVSSVKKLTRLGWHPRNTIEDSIREYVKWFSDSGYAKLLDRTALARLSRGIT